LCKKGEKILEIFQQEWEILLRIILSVVFGFAIGFEREITGKFAGLRTHILVCLGACVFTVISIYGFKFVTAEGVSGINDPARIAAQIITGIGFIGAGTVMRHGTSISGITTAATLWVVASIGMACGCGMFILAGCSTLVSLAVLISVRHFEKRFLYSKLRSDRTVNISFAGSAANSEAIMKAVRENFKIINKIEKRTMGEDEFTYKINVFTQKPIIKINEILNGLPNITALEIIETHE